MTFFGEKTKFVQFPKSQLLFNLKDRDFSADNIKTAIFVLFFILYKLYETNLKINV